MRYAERPSCCRSSVRVAPVAPFSDSTAYRQEADGSTARAEFSRKTGDGKKHAAMLVMVKLGKGRKESLDVKRVDVDLLPHPETMMDRGICRLGSVRGLECFSERLPKISAHHNAWHKPSPRALFRNRREICSHLQDCFRTCSDYNVLCCAHSFIHFTNERRLDKEEQGRVRWVKGFHLKTARGMPPAHNQPVYSNLGEIRGYRTYSTGHHPMHPALECRETLSVVAVTLTAT